MADVADWVEDTPASGPRVPDETIGDIHWASRSGSGSDMVLSARNCRIFSNYLDTNVTTNPTDSESRGDGADQKT